ncbi:uncharacterized protein LOC110443279 [Mizuhopecten yessoensis]|uniref:Uncharacterized protein n=1 Tax=Mizuhopecten yessoensis TaxID=6573 RepID=A0A210PF88_MIZYE|nr:uncharacterized protein LOC110443279 [Mizuhopecten yessoensis]OWF35152.1 hypothetical protein KP79_PYT05413 [Mizuhopecten yessoensis]
MEVDRLGKLAAMIGVIAIIMEIAGFATRGWIRFNHVINDFGLAKEILLKFELGLWSVSICMNGVCATTDQKQWETDPSVQRYSELLDIDRYKVLAGLAIGGGAVSLLFLVLHIRRPILVSMCYGLLSLGGFAVSGTLLWYVVGKFAKLATNLHPTLSNPDGLTAMTPYSVVVAGIGAALSFVVAVLIFVEVFRTSCLGEGGIIVNKYPSVPHNTLVNINHHVTAMPPPMPTQTTHVGITLQNPRM